MRRRELFLESAKAMKSGIMFSVAFSIVLPFLLWFWKPDFKVPLGLVVVLMAISFLIISSLMSALFITLKKYEEEKDKKVNLPKLLKVISSNSGATFILNKSSIFGFNTFVSIFKVDESGSEIFLGIGKVINIQGDGLIQIEVMNWSDEYNTVLDSLVENERNALSKISVKPHITTEKILEIIGGT